MAEQILAHPVTSPIYIGELVFPKYRVFRQDALSFTFPPKHLHPFLDEIEVIAEDIVVEKDLRFSFCHHNAEIP